jgi:hypothetical protein
MSCASLARAQEVTGSIAGTVRDASGAAVANATITITDTDKKLVVRTLRTDSSGAYAAPLLPVGNYEVAVEAPNFKKYVQSRIKLDVNQRLTIDAPLEAGNISEVVTVESAPLQVDTQTPTAANLISGTQARELSLNNRNFVQLTTLMPGVSSNLADQVYVGTTNPSGQVNLVSIAVNGARSAANNWTVDGADITDQGSNLTIQLYPSVDAIGEFKVLRSLYPAEEGRSGGGQINVVTKSGTNEFHGNLYEFLRNDKLNANNFVLNRNTSPSNLDASGKAKRPPLRYNNFGYTIGGPLYLPRFGEGGKSYYSGKNRTFFFFSQEWRRAITYPVFTPLVPNSLLKQGIFPVPVCVQVTGSTCTATATQITNINPVAQAYINDIYGPLPEPDANYVLTSPQRNVFNFRQEILRIDHNVSQKLALTYRLEFDSIPTQEANSLFSSGSGLPGVSTTTTDSPGRSHVGRFTYTINPDTILDGGYTYAYGAIKSTPVGKLLLSNSTVRVPLPFTNTLGRIPTVFPGFAATSTFGPYDNFSNAQKIFANLTKIVGAHTMKFGGQLNFSRKHENAAGGNQGNFYFATGPRPAGTPGYLQQWANFLLGNARLFTQSSLDITNDLRRRYHEFYAQDEWRARPNLTLYYGGRFSLFRQPYDTNGLFTNFDPALFDPSRAFQVDANGNRIGPGDPLNGIIINSQNVPPGGTASPYGVKVSNEDNKTFAPRVGLAWDPFKRGKTSVRTGYGIYYDLSTYAFFQDASQNNPPFNNSVSIFRARLDNPSAGTVGVNNGVVDLYGVGIPYHAPYMQHWSFDVQQQLARNTVIDVGYYGSKGTHLPGIIDINMLPPGAAVAAGIQQPGEILQDDTALNQIRPYRGYRSINIVQNRFNSNYHSLQVFLQQRFAGGSQINVAYTWSKNLTDNQTDRSSAPQDAYNIRAERGPAQLDRRHILTINYVYEIPFYREQRGFVGHLLGGWELSGITIYETGLPYTVFNFDDDPGGTGVIDSATASGRPDLIGDPNTGPKTFNQWFNTAAFIPDPPNGQNRPGNAGRGVVRGPGLQRWDISLFKNIRIGESKRLQLRGEAFNVFNHTNFNTFSTNIYSSSFGRILTAHDARIIQLAAKFYF